MRERGRVERPAVRAGCPVVRLHDQSVISAEKPCLVFGPEIIVEDPPTGGP
jgi:hypothetical protein